MPLHIIVRKSERVLELLEGERRLMRVPVGIGRQPIGHKQAEGDHRTPEGEYRICVKNPRSRFHLSMGINYPNGADARRALEAGRISEETADRILKAERAGERPPWDTLLGGEIYLHGRLEDRPDSRGCVVLYDPDMERLFEATPLGTPVTILP